MELSYYILYTNKYRGKGPGDEGHCSVPGVNPISRKRDESVSVMSFPNGTRGPSRKRDKRKCYSFDNVDWLNSNFSSFDSRLSSNRHRMIYRFNFNTVKSTVYATAVGIII